MLAVRIEDSSDGGEVGYLIKGKVTSFFYLILWKGAKEGVKKQQTIVSKKKGDNKGAKKIDLYDKCNAMEEFIVKL